MIRAILGLLLILSGIVGCTLLTGCSSTPGRFDNLIVVSLAGDRAFVSSLYGPIGITAELRADDARELKRMREQSRDAEEMLRILSRQQITTPKGP